VKRQEEERVEGEEDKARERKKKKCIYRIERTGKARQPPAARLPLPTHSDNSFPHTQQQYCFVFSLFPASVYFFVPLMPLHSQLSRASYMTIISTHA
jgi:hypothetical protein